jgi:predicted RNase H-like HicB family nuclease
MTMSAFVELLATGGYSATILSWSEMTAQGSTEEEALERLREAVKQRLARGKIIPLDLGGGGAANPWLEMIERFRDNPLLDDVDQAIRDEREGLHELGVPSERGMPVD